ncbi:hypothetical protein GCM10023322_52420 [Rugosimonospora acidiphila]|uniref:Uncharacterized protein n=1 Tax=Rugosimonospora acidiphila TaxID=556531 RepID=A0ABP9S7X7_9ACTN
MDGSGDRCRAAAWLAIDLMRQAGPSLPQRREGSASGLERVGGPDAGTLGVMRQGYNRQWPSG